MRSSRRHGTPKTEGYYILHEGYLGVFGDQGLKEDSYKNVEEKKEIRFKATNAWLGFTDKYWAATLLPDTKANLAAAYSANPPPTRRPIRPTICSTRRPIAPGASGAADFRLFAGAKEVQTIDAYDKALGLNRFELLIDWGWFYFITKPMFKAIDYFYHRVGNFGLAILIVTVLIKLLFFPLANKSYASMAKMKAVQPEMAAIRERYGDDKMKQQQALMELYKKEKINPLAGCLPIVVQIPVFFALYKVLFVTIEMRHAPFYGWIKDLSAPDPTNIFNLFGLIPVDPTVLPVIGHFLHLGFWPIVMGITMFFQMKLNPAPPDPTQKMIFDWMPLIFTFMLASFSAGLVIYWAWNNTLSVLQQSVIMNKNGAKIELFDNIKRHVREEETGQGDLTAASAQRQPLPATEGRMMTFLKGLLAATIAASLLVPAMAVAKQADGKSRLKIVVRPKYRSGNGFLPGYRQPPSLAEWRDRDARHGGRAEPYGLRYWSGGELRYGWGGPGFYRGQWNGGSFGPCYTRTPIGMIWNCGR